ncbi:MAG: hypothetical protein AAB897_00705 [Patescibacteria group bacterium]
MNTVLKYLYFVSIVVFILAQFMPFVSVLAQVDAQGNKVGSNVGCPPNCPLTVDKVITTLCTIMKWLFWILIVLSVVMVIIAAYMYVTSRGDAESVSKANKTILYAAIGVAVALFAKGMPAIIGSFVGVSGVDLPSQCN